MKGAAVEVVAARSAAVVEAGWSAVAAALSRCRVSGGFSSLFFTHTICSYIHVLIINFSYS